MQAICSDGLSSAYDSVNLPTLVESACYASHLSKLLELVLKAGTLSILVEPVGDAPAYGWLGPVFWAPCDRLTKNTLLPLPSYTSGFNLSPTCKNFSWTVPSTFSRLIPTSLAEAGSGLGGV